MQPVSLLRPILPDIFQPVSPPSPILPDLHPVSPPCPISLDLQPLLPPSVSDSELEHFSLPSEILELRRRACDYSQVFVRRSNIFNDVLNQFKSFGLTSIYVKFDGEKGDNFDGLTKGTYF